MLKLMQVESSEESIFKADPVGGSFPVPNPFEQILFVVLMTNGQLLTVEKRTNNGRTTQIKQKK